MNNRRDFAQQRIENGLVKCHWKSLRDGNKENIPLGDKRKRSNRLWISLICMHREYKEDQEMTQNRLKMRADRFNSVGDGVRREKTELNNNEQRTGSASKRKLLPQCVVMETLHVVAISIQGLRGCG